MRFPPLEPGHLLERENRFRARVALGGETVWAHVADPGRLRELLIRGRRLWLARATNSKRVTTHDVVLVEHRGQLVCINTRYPNNLAQEALQDGTIPWGEIAELRREVTHGDSRFDFRLIMADGRPFWVEVKAVSLVEGRLALFPDAPTLRGARHLRELTEIVREGGQAGVIFVLQRGDADVFAPNRAMDPAFAEALDVALATGVRVQAWASEVTTAGMYITHRVNLWVDS